MKKVKNTIQTSEKWQTRSSDNGETKGPIRSKEGKMKKVNFESHNFKALWSMHYFLIKIDGKHCVYYVMTLYLG